MRTIQRFNRWTVEIFRWIGLTGKYVEAQGRVSEGLKVLGLKVRGLRFVILMFEGLKVRGTWFGALISEGLRPETWGLMSEVPNECWSENVWCSRFLLNCAAW